MKERRKGFKKERSSRFKQKGKDQKKKKEKQKTGVRGNIFSLCM